MALSTDYTLGNDKEGISKIYKNMALIMNLLLSYDK